METSVKINGIDIDMLSNDVFIRKINEFLTTEKIQVIFFASAEVLERASVEEEYKKIVDMAELFLPGEEASLLSAEHAAELKAGDMVVSCQSFGLVLENLHKEDRSVYIVSNTEEDAGRLEQYCKKMQPELKIVGFSIYNSEVDGAAIVNEINSHIPDFLLVDLPVGEQENWIMAHVAQLNAKLCIAIGGVANHIMLPQEKVPAWVKKMHLTNLYQKFRSRV